MTRGWKGNVLGLQKWEVEYAHRARLDATEAVADLMRRGRSFPEAKAEVMRRARSAYKYSRPELYEGCMRTVSDVRFSDMPPAIINKIADDMVPDLERIKGKPLSRLSKWCWRNLGFWW